MKSWENLTEEVCYRWLEMQFASKAISRPDGSNNKNKKPDFQVSLPNDSNLIVECKQIDNCNEKLVSYRDGKFTDKNIYGKFEQYSQLKPQYCGTDADIRVLLVGSDPLCVSNSIELETHNPGQFNFVTDSLYGDEVVFKMHNNKLSEPYWVGIMNTLPKYVSAIGFIYEYQKFTSLNQKEFFVVFYRNLMAEVQLKDSLFFKKDSFHMR